MRLAGGPATAWRAAAAAAVALVAGATGGFLVGLLRGSRPEEIPAVQPGRPEREPG